MVHSVRVILDTTLFRLVSHLNINTGVLEDFLFGVPDVGYEGGDGVPIFNLTVLDGVSERVHLFLNVREPVLKFILVLQEHLLEFGVLLQVKLVLLQDCHSALVLRQIFLFFLQIVLIVLFVLTEGLPFLEGRVVAKLFIFFVLLH